MAEVVEMPIAVIDTDVLVSNTKRRKIVEATVRGHLDGVWSPHIIGELYRILTVQWLEKHGFQAHSLRELSKQSKALMEILTAAFHVVDAGPHESEELADHDDFHLIRAARMVHAHFVVSENTSDFPPCDRDGRSFYDGVEYVTCDALLVRLNLK